MKGQRWCSKGAPYPLRVFYPSTRQPVRILERQGLNPSGKPSGTRQEGVRDFGRRWVRILANMQASCRREGRQGCAAPASRECLLFWQILLRNTRLRER